MFPIFIVSKINILNNKDIKNPITGEAICIIIHLPHNFLYIMYCPACTTISVVFLASTIVSYFSGITYL